MRMQPQSNGQSHSAEKLLGAELEHYDDGEDNPTHEHPAAAPELGRYDDDDVVTAPWPPRQN